jgi:DNA-binding GntR family transcriptional regulator
MIDVMAELEAMCGRLAARRAGEVDQLRIRRAHDDCAVAIAANDPDAYYRLNEVFHEAVYWASHNAFLAEQSTALNRRLRPYRRLQLRVRNRMCASFEEHGRIVEAIVAGNEPAAAECLRSHVVVQGERFADLVASLAAFRSERKATAG